MNAQTNRTYAVYSIASPGRYPAPLRALCKALDMLGWQEAAEEGVSPALAIVFPGLGARLQAEHLRFYHDRLHCQRSQVVCADWHGSHDRPSGSDQRHPWLFWWTPQEFRLGDFLEWCQGGQEPVSKETDGVRVDPPSPIACTHLLDAFLSGDERTQDWVPALDALFTCLEDENGELPKTMSRILSTPKLRRSACPPAADGEPVGMGRFYLLLCLLAADRPNVEHDSQRVLCEWPTSRNARGILDGMRTLRLVDACEDLRQSLAERAVFPGSVLVIDDHLGPVRGCLCSLWDIFYCSDGDSRDLYIWSPRGDESKQLLEGLCDYTSRNPLIVDPDIAVERLCGTGSTRVPLAEVLKKCSFILVDLLLDPQNPGLGFRGVETIRGLTRYLRDQKSRAEVIAISRSADPELIQKALHVGASDYILKSRLLAVPAVLSRARHGVSDTTVAYHRNFRSLYRLPNETIGLLRSVRVPPVDYSRSVPSPSPEISLARRLLTSIPKADLHTHVGTCMTPEFLVLASLVMLSRHVQPTIMSAEDGSTDFRRAVQEMFDVWSGRKRPYLCRDLFGDLDRRHPLLFTADMSLLAEEVRGQVRGALASLAAEEVPSPQCVRLRSILAKQVDIPEYEPLAMAVGKLRKENWSDLDVFLFAMANITTEGCRSSCRVGLENADLLPLYTLFLACKGDGATVEWSSDEEQWKSGVEADTHGDRYLKLADLLDCGTQCALSSLFDLLGLMHAAFHNSAGKWSLKRFREEHWAMPGKPGNAPPLRFQISSVSGRNCPKGLPEQDANPLLWQVATGRRSHSLKEYLQGCEFAGKHHLRHPFLMHLYAQQTVERLASEGVMYAELRGSPDGYAGKGGESSMTFQEAYGCLLEAFEKAMKSRETGRGLPYTRLFHGERCQPSGAGKSLPVKVSLVFVGKRHKTLQQMIQEAAAVVVLRGQSSAKAKAARGYVAEAFDKCQVVGFDLAGPEAEHQPSEFRQEFSRLSRMHIPITVHAGENASSRFIEDAILELGARRIGHGLSIADSHSLMDRLREERVCIELCPVSNHQTCAFLSDGSGGRVYPLAELIQNGNPVCINTDNRLTSGTDMVSEYLQASYALGGNGLSFWEALRLVRMGFVHSFLDLPERAHLLEVVDQIVFDLFSKPEAVQALRDLISLQRGRDI